MQGADVAFEVASGLRPAPRRGLADHAADAIRAAIFSGEIQLGERLIEEDLAERLNVSRGPVREAFVRLAEEGLVHLERHRGATVSRLSVEEVHEIYSLRVALERLAVERACESATADDLADMHAVLRQFAQLQPPPDPSRVAELDVAFHDALFRAAHHERLFGAWRVLRSQIRLYLDRRATGTEDLDAWLASHEQLVLLVERRLPEEAKQAVETHIDGAYRKLLGLPERPAAADSA